MKTPVILMLLFVLLFVSSNALKHRVRVFLKTSSSDIGSTVEMRTSVLFNLPNGDVLFRSSFTTGLPENNEFDGIGAEIFDETFDQDPRSINFIITEDDGDGISNDDAVCRLLAQPPSWPVGSNRFDCIRDSNNGLNREWRIIMQVDSSLDIFQPVSR